MVLTLKALTTFSRLSSLDGLLYGLCNAGWSPFPDIKCSLIWPSLANDPVEVATDDCCKLWFLSSPIPNLCLSVVKFSGRQIELEIYIWRIRILGRCISSLVMSRPLMPVLNACLVPRGLPELFRVFAQHVSGLQQKLCKLSAFHAHFWPKDYIGRDFKDLWKELTVKRRSTKPVSGASRW